MTRVKMSSPSVQAAIYSALSQNPAVTRQVRRVAAQLRDEARRRAPRDTGAGAKSIRVKRYWDRTTRRVSYRVSWDKDHFYMLFHEVGTENLPARPFLRPAADSLGGRRVSG